MRRRAWTIFAFTGLVLAPMQSGADYVFQPTQCAQCPTMTEVHWTFDSAELPYNPNCPGCDEYINYLDYYRMFVANQYVDKVDFRLDSFETETDFDFLSFYELGSQTSVNLTGSPTTGWFSVQSSSVVQEKPVEFNFDTDLSVTAPGFSIGRARVCCQSTAGATTPTYTMSDNERWTGVLLAAHDVVYAKKSVAGSSYRLNIALWGNNDTGTPDFDVYIRCNALPTPSTYDFAGRSGDSEEFISIEGQGGCPISGTWYIAVHAYSGGGRFNLTASRMLSTRYYSSLRAGTNFNATTANLNQFKSTLEGALRQFYGSTEGQVLIDHVDLYNSNGCGPTSCGGGICHFCFRNQQGTGAAVVCSADTNTITVDQGYWGDPEGIAHELGHAYLCVGDEYADYGSDRCANNCALPCTSPNCTGGCLGSNFCWECGHSNMSYPWLSQNNFCYHEQTNLEDHRKDKTPLAPDDPGIFAVWDSVSSLTAWRPQWTPDNYDYRDHDFNTRLSVDLH